MGENTIIIGADGLLVGYSVKTGALVIGLTSKVHCIESLCFAASARVNNETIGYDLSMVVDNEPRRNKAPEAAETQFHTVLNSVIPQLVDVL